MAKQTTRRQLRRFHPFEFRRQGGGAALEYILVSTFAAVVTISAMGYLGRILKQQLAHLGSRLGDSAGPEGDWPTEP